MATVEPRQLNESGTPVRPMSIAVYVMGRVDASMSEGGQHPCIFKDEGDKTTNPTIGGVSVDGRCKNVGIVIIDLY